MNTTSGCNKTTFVVCSMGIMALLASIIPTLHYDSGGYAVLSATVALHLVIASACYTIDFHYNKSRAYKSICWLIVLFSVMYIGLAIAQTIQSPGELVMATHVGFLIGTSSSLNSLGILILRLHLPADQRNGSSANMPIR